MKYIAILSLAATLAVGLSATAGAAPVDEFAAVENAGPIAGSADLHPYHPCHGRTSGTAHAECGTLSGGPSGGLF